MPEPAASGGQAAPANSGNGTTAAAPTSTQGQSAPAAQTTAQGSVASEESFFDPKSIEHSPELKSAYKQMQSKWTKENQRFKGLDKKIAAYDAITANPRAAIEAYAQQNGFQLVQRDPKAKPEDATPKTWAEVYANAKAEVLKEIQPMLGEVRQLKQQNVEAYLDNNHPDWRTYENEMLEKLQSHPSLANEPDALYRLSVPPEVLEARAHKSALAKLKGTGEAAQVSGAGKAAQTATEERPGIGATFNDFVAYAKQKLARDGIRPLGD